jgi:predicted phosphohydrolase
MSLRRPKEQKDVEFIARMPGHFVLICADHDWVGMTADILVE